MGAQRQRQYCLTCWLLYLLLHQAWYTSAAAAAAERMVTIKVNRLASVPAALAANSSSSRVPSIAADRKLHLLIGLRSRKPKLLDTTAQRYLAMPGSSSSSSKRQLYLTTAQFGQKFGAAPRSINLVTNYLRNMGLTVNVTSDQLYLEVTGAAGNVTRAFHTQIVVTDLTATAQIQQQESKMAGTTNNTASNTTDMANNTDSNTNDTANDTERNMTDTANGTDSNINDTANSTGSSTNNTTNDTESNSVLYAPIDHPKLPTSIADCVTSILGLDNIPSVRSGSTRLGPATAAAAAAAAAAGSSSTGGGQHRRSLLKGENKMDANQYQLTASRIRTLYNFPNDTFSGQGSTVAVLTYQKYNSSLITEYATANELPGDVDIFDIYVVNPNRVGNDDPTTTLLNLELMVAVAPLAKYTVYLSENTDYGETVLFNKVANQNTDSTVLYTWWRGESPDDSNSDVERLLKQMAIQGQSVIVATGNCGSRVDTGSTCLDKTGVSFPANSEYVTAVGGTTPTLYSGDEWAKETGQANSSGGHSSVFKLPEYQRGVLTLVNRTYRNLPDVALAADPAIWPYEILIAADSWSTEGSASAAASVWAGFVALVNACRGRAQLKPSRLGPPNPAIYQIAARPTDYAATFHDVLTGSNGAYSAGPGWDAVTGWGSMNGAQLMGKLCPGFTGACCYNDPWTGDHCVPSVTNTTCDSEAGGVFQPGKSCTAGFSDAATCASSSSSSSGGGGSGKPWP